MTVSERFQTLLGQIAVSKGESDGYTTHQYGVRQAIAAEYPGSECHVIGSHARGSAIGGTSDLDVLARLAIGDLRRSSTSNELVSSDTALANVRRRLAARFPRTEIGRDGQAVVIGFADGARDVDVVPAAWNGMIDVTALGAKRPAFYIPDGQGGWVQTAPQAHNDYLANADARAGGRLKFVAQLLRRWRSSRATKLPMLTFHAELVLANDEVCVRPRSYAQTLADALATLSRRGGRSLQDPLGISGYIPIASTDAKRLEVVNALAHAADHAANAVSFEQRGQLADAYAQWSLVFNGKFPSR
jgi:hypothetical protein